MRPFRHPKGAKAPSPNGTWVSAAVNFYIEILVRVPGDESVGMSQFEEIPSPGRGFQGSCA